MRCAHRSYLPGLVVLLLLLGFVAPQAAAQDIPPEQPCPEGLVYYEPGDICLLPEDIPSDQEEGDQPADEAQQSTEEPVVDEQQSVEDEQIDDETQPANDEQQPALDQEQAAGDPSAQIRNLTLLTFSCPINWNPATRDIEASREMCTEPTVPDVTYTVLYEGVAQTTVPFRTDVDVAAAGIPLNAGMWTIQESPSEGLDDPFAYCAIYAADGSSRLTVEETVPGGSLDILLAADEEVNCEWYSVATVPEAIGDPNAAPSLGLEVKVFSCPAPAEFKGGLDDCTLPLPGPVTVEASYGGQVMATGTLSSPELIYEVHGNALSGEWTIRPILPEGWIDPHLTCTSVDNNGTYTGEVTFFPPADGSLGVTVRLNPDQRVQCQVWVFAGDVRESVVVVTRDCPEDFNAATLSPGVRKATCPGLQFQPVSITIDDAAPVQGESTRNGVAVFPTQPGTWRIAVDPGLGVVGRGVTFVTCDHTFATLDQVQTIEPTINSDGRSVSIELDEGDSLRCDFFQGPALAAAEAPAPAEETEAVTTEPEAGTTGDTTDAPDAAPETGAGTDPAPQTGTFGGGSATSADDPGTDGGTTDEPPLDTTDSGSADEGGMTDQPTSGGATSELSIQHYDCTSPVADATVDDLVANCTASVAPGAWVMNSEPLDVSDGYAVWEGLEPDTVSVSNTAADGKEDASSAVYCSIAPVGSEPLVGLQVPVRNGAIEIVFDQPSVVYCAWFVAP